jgi:hypothetical protein
MFNKNINFKSINLKIFQKLDKVINNSKEKEVIIYEMI